MSTRLIVCALVLSGCGGNKTASKPATENSKPSDTQLVASLPLRTSDLPAGFAAVDSKMASAVPIVNSCVVSLQLASGTQAGATFLQDRNEIASQSYVFAQPAVSSQILASAAAQPAQKCLLDLVQTQLNKNMNTANISDVQAQTTFESLDPATALYRAVVVKGGRASTQTVATSDLVITQSDRSITVVWLNWYNGSPDQTMEKSLVTALRARAATTFA